MAESTRCVHRCTLLTHSVAGGIDRHINCLGPIRVSLASRTRYVQDFEMPNGFSPQSKQLSVTTYLIIAAFLLCFASTFSLLAPIYLSFLLTLLISLALNPLVTRLRSVTGGRQRATGLVVFALLTMVILSGWAFFSPIKESS